MEATKYIGVHISESQAAIAVLTPHSKGYEIEELSSFDNSVVADQEPSSLGLQIAEYLKARDIEICDCAIALDCSLFTQHNIFTQFSDVKQIAQTVRFDTEEAMGMDISDLAVTFTITRKESIGSRVSVFTAKKEILKNIILDFQSNGLEPVTIEPDAVCLARCLMKDVGVSEDENPLFSVFSQRSCYFIVPGRSGEQPFVRTFLAQKGYDSSRVLSREVPLTINSPSISNAINIVYVSDQDSGQRFTENTGIDLKYISENTAHDSSVLHDDQICVPAAAACGAAMINFVKSPKIDFRKDFMQYQGKRKILETSLRFLSLSLSVALIFIALLWTVRLVEIRSNVKDINAKISDEYTKAMKRSKVSNYPVKDLKGELNKLRKIKEGVSTGDQEGPPANLMMVLEAINNTPKNIGLKIDSISITEKTIRIDGSTTSRANTQAVLSEFRQHKGIKVGQETLKQVGPEDKFVVTLEPVK